MFNAASVLFIEIPNLLSWQFQDGNGNYCKYRYYGISLITYSSP